MTKTGGRYPEVTVIIPTYNELENLKLIVRRVSESLKEVGHELIVVDDDSPDGTGKLADELAKRLTNVRALHRKGGKGLAPAVVHGLKHARAPIICVLDADLQHPPEKIPELLEEIRMGADIAIASMYMKKGAVEERGRWRKLVSRGARFLSRLAFPQARSLTDPLSGFFAFRREVVSGAKLDPVGFKILLEILVKGTWKKTVEVPFVPGKRIHGRSKLGFREYSNYLRHLVRLSGWSKSGGADAEL